MSRLPEPLPLCCSCFARHRLPGGARCDSCTGGRIRTAEAEPTTAAPAPPPPPPPPPRRPGLGGLADLFATIPTINRNEDQ